MKITKLILVAVLHLLALPHAFASAAPVPAGAPPALTPHQRMALKPLDVPPYTLISVPLDQLLPTQPAVGYDQIYYKLGKYQAEDRAMAATKKPEKFDDFCKASGLGGIAKNTNNIAGATLIRPLTKLKCELDKRTDDSKTEMKTVVIGPGGKVYLTDGHHTFTRFWEADNGVNHKLAVPVRVTDNFSNLSESAFWAKMEATHKVWLMDGNNQPITPAQLPKRLGLDQFGDDPYRSIVYFARDIAVDIPKGKPEFLEFYWADWVRNKSLFHLATYKLDTVPGYAAAIKNVSKAIVALPPDAVVSADMNAQSLGKKPAVDLDELQNLAKPNGKLNYSINYKKWLASNSKTNQPAIARLPSN